LHLTSGAFPQCGTTAQTFGGLGQEGLHKLCAGYFGTDISGTITPATGQFIRTGTSNISFESIGSWRNKIYALDQQ
jgi:hypothetical protein